MASCPAPETLTRWGNRTVKAQDVAGNESAPLNISVLIAPPTVLDPGPSGLTSSRTRDVRVLEPGSRHHRVLLLARRRAIDLPVRGAVHQPDRRRAHVRGGGGRRGRGRPDTRHPHVDRRRHPAADGDRLRPGGRGDGDHCERGVLEQRVRLHLRLQARRGGRGRLHLPARVDRAGDRSPHARGGGDGRGRQRRRQPRPCTPGR